MKKIIFIFLIFYCTSNIAHSQWIWQNPKPQGNSISDFCILSENTLIAFGSPSTIIKTTDGGNSWLNLSNYSINDDGYKYSYFFNENTGWIQTNNYPNKVYKTTDGGKNWARFDSTIQVNMLKFINANTGYSLGAGPVKKTTNGGANWFNTNSPVSNYQMTFLDFVDVNTGWAVGYRTSPYPNENYILKTTDGGLNWNIYNPGFSSPIISSFMFINAQTGWLSGEYGSIRKTTNGGENWISLPFNLNVTSELYFYNDQIGWLIPDSHDSSILKTTNGGINWIQTKLPFWIPFQRCFKFFDQSTGFIFGGSKYNQILKSTNGGLNWFFLSSGFYNLVSSVYFTDANYGWAVGDWSQYLKTTNGGNEWSLENIGIPSYYGYTDIYFKDQQTGWLLSDYKILKTTNSGTNWYTVYDTAEYGIHLGTYFSFKNENEIFIPKSYCIFKSTNGGLDWFRQYINNGSYYIETIKFFSESNGWLISNLFDPDYSKVFKSTDGGQNWIENLNTDTRINNLYFLNSNTGWITASKPNYPGTYTNLIYKTTNGGLNWLSYIHPYNIAPSFDKIYFENEYTGICIGWTYLHKTTNGGINWNSYAMLSGFQNLFFLNSNTGWLCGGPGNILKTTTGGLTFISKINSDIPNNYLLLQNYPNPFNPTTNIHYEIPKNGFVKLVVFDILGREVQTLVNEKQNAGTYEVTFNARQPGLGSNLSSGIYFYTLTSGDFKETKKFVLLK